MSRDTLRKDGSRWGERLVRNGKIRWHGQDYVPMPDVGSMLPAQSGDAVIAALDGGPTPDPTPMGEYDGRFDGRRALFYTYGRYSRLEGKVFLHSFPDPTNEEHGMDWPGPNCINGVFRWECWARASEKTGAPE